jgi:hypothetical protein
MSGGDGLDEFRMYCVCHWRTEKDLWFDSSLCDRCGKCHFRCLGCLKITDKCEGDYPWEKQPR